MSTALNGRQRSYSSFAGRPSRLRMLGSGYGCLRHTFCLVNALMWLAGCGLLGAGLWLRFAYGGYAALLSSYQGLSADGLLTTAGVLTATVSFFGCCGACLQNRCLLMTYFCCVAAAFLLQLVALVLCFVFHVQLQQTLRDELVDGVRHHYNESNALGLTWDHIQRQFDCCGVESYRDWYGVSAWPNQTYVPASCCLQWRRNDTACGRSGRPSHWHGSGCYEQLHIWFLEQLHVIGVVALLLVFLQIFGLVASMMLYCTLGYKRKRFYTYRSYEPSTS